MYIVSSFAPLRFGQRQRSQPIEPLSERFAPVPKTGTLVVTSPGGTVEGIVRWIAERFQERQWTPAQNAEPGTAKITARYGTSDVTLLVCSQDGTTRIRAEGPSREAVDHVLDQIQRNGRQGNLAFRRIVGR